jgi:hypothetical protein
MSGYASESGTSSWKRRRGAVASYSVRVCAWNELFNGLSRLYGFQSIRVCAWNGSFLFDCAVCSFFTPSTWNELLFLRAVKIVWITVRVRVERVVAAHV